MAVPRFLETAQLLTIARHEARVDDLLDFSPSVVRLTLRPWQGPLTRGEAIEARLEICVEKIDQSSVYLRCWADATDPAPEEERIATARLSPAWLESRILAFVGRVLNLE